MYIKGQMYLPSLLLEIDIILWFIVDYETRVVTLILIYIQTI